MPRDNKRDTVIMTGHALDLIQLGSKLNFHDRLKTKVRALTAHVNRSELEFERMLNRMNPDEIKTLARTLQKELVQVIQAVEEAK